MTKEPKHHRSQKQTNTEHSILHALFQSEKTTQFSEFSLANHIKTCLNITINFVKVSPCPYPMFANTDVAIKACTSESAKFV